MLGLEDLLFIWTRIYGEPDPHIDRMSIISEASGDISNPPCLAFLPAIVYDRQHLRTRVLPKRFWTITYRLPKDLIVPNPWKIKEGLDNIYEDAVSKIQKFLLNPEALHVHGMSLGTGIASRVAKNGFSRKVSLVAGSGNLAYSNKRGAATKRIYGGAVNNGFTDTDFTSALAEYNPEDLANLSERIQLLVEYSAGFDIIVPSRDTAEFVRKVKSVHDVKVKKRYFYGHGLTMAFHQNQF